MSNSGLQLNRFQTFTNDTPSGTTVTYATQSYVNQTVNNSLLKGTTVTIQIEDGLSVVGKVIGSNYSVVEVGLCAGLSDLKDVSFPTAPVSGEYLIYNGTCWTTGTGVCVDNLKFTQLTDTPASITADNFVVGNNLGTSLAFTPNTYLNLNNFNGGDGIAVAATPSSQSSTISLNIPSLIPSPASVDLSQSEIPIWPGTGVQQYRTPFSSFQ